MPRSRNSRSSSPLKSLKTTTGQSEYDRIFQNVQEMFSDTVDADVIYFVLTECHWRSEEAIDKLLTIVEKSEAQPEKTKSKLQEIAEGVLGPLRHDECKEQGHTHPGANQSTIQTGASSDSFVRTVGHVNSLQERNHEEHQILYQSSSSPSAVDPAAREIQGRHVRNVLPEKGVRNVSSDPVLAWEFSPLSKESKDYMKLNSDNDKAVKSVESKDDSWRAIKAPKSSRTSSNSPQQNIENESNSIKLGAVKVTGQVQGGVFSDSPPGVSGKGVKPGRQKLEMSRNFPVRLLSKSPEEVHEKISFSQTMHHSVSESVLSKTNINTKGVQPESFELDETVIKCITEINHDLLDDTEKKTDKGIFGRSRSSSIRSLASENESGGTGCSTPDPSYMRTSTPSNHPMTLPVIGLSVEAPEFVPRPKKTKTEELAQSSPETVASTCTTTSSPLSSAPLKIDTKSTSVPVSSPHQSVQGAPPYIRIGSPRIAVVSPGVAISPPSNVSVTNSAHLTGSPMFITPKWQPVFPGVYSPQQPPPPLQPRLVAQQLPQQMPSSYRFPPPGTQFPPYSRVMYPVGTQPVFRVAGLPPRQVPMPQVVSEVKDMAAMATGQPIMATGKSVHSTHREGMNSAKGEMYQSKEVSVEIVRAHIKAGKRVMVIIRGLPGSGKSTLARAIRFDGVVLSTDDYFTKGDMYEYDPDRLTEAHQWNRERAKEAIKMGTNPIIIDNTNTQKWEFKPYVSMALNNNYHVEIMEPDTPWKFKEKELAKRTLHGVPEDQIRRMLERYEHNLTVAAIFNTTKKPVTNGSADPRNSNISIIENSPSPALERKPIKSVKSEAARRSRSRGKSNKVKDLKAKRKLQKPSSNSPVLGKSDVNELQEWQISESDKRWESPNSTQSFENTNATVFDEWTTDDWTGERNDTNDDVNFNNSENMEEFDISLNAKLKVAQSTDLPTTSPFQGEINFYPHYSNTPSMTSSKTGSPIIEYSVMDSYISNHHGKIDFAKKSEEKTVCSSEGKTIKAIESELSEEILGYVNEVMEEHSSSSLTELSKEDRDRIEEELKALLQFYPIEDDEQRRKAEILIGLKVNKTGTEEVGYMETGEILYESCYMEENTEIYMPAENKTTEYDKNMIAQIVEQENTFNGIMPSMQESDTENTADDNLDLDNSLNKEVANIFKVSVLDMETKCHENNKERGISYNNIVTESNKEIEIPYDNVVTDLIETSIVENNVEDSGLSVQDVQTIKRAEEINIHSGDEESKSIHQPQDSFNSLESFSNRSQVQESIYDIDSAIIRAETSDFVETDSIFESDSAIIAASMDSMDHDSLYDTDSAIIAVSSDINDRDNLCEADSAIIAASKDLGDTEISVDDADVMKRLKASIEELKYWGHIELEEEVSAEKVTSEWDDCYQDVKDQWQNEASSISFEAKPQRLKRNKIESYNGKGGSSSELEMNEKHTDNGVSNKVIASESVEADIQNADSYLLDADLELSKHFNNDLNAGEPTLQGSAGENAASLSCYINNSGSFNHSFSYGGNESIKHSDDLADSHYVSGNELPIILQDENQSMASETVHFESELSKGNIDTDLENSIFISDDEDLINEAFSSNVYSGWLEETECSDSYSFVPDDDINCLNTKLKDDTEKIETFYKEAVPFTDFELKYQTSEEVKISKYSRLEKAGGIQTFVTNMPTKSAEHQIDVNKTNKLAKETASEEYSGTINKPIVSTVSGNLNGSSISMNSDNSRKTENDLLGLKYCDVNSGHSSQSQSSPKKRKQSKSRMAAKLQKPFFDVSETQRFVSNDWSTFSSPFEINNAFEPSGTNNFVERYNFKSEGTLTESGDFRVLNLYSQGETIDCVHQYQFIKSRSRSIDMDDIGSNMELRKTKIADIRKIDKSSSTDDLETDRDNENIEFLKTCFPNISEDELDCVLLNCANNVEWALNLLLDWKYHLDFTDKEKENFVKEISKCKRCPSPEISATDTEISLESNPDSLLDLCLKKIEEENIADRGDIEKQIILSGKERLDRIEDESITKIRIWRSLSLSESSFDANRSGISGSHSVHKVRRSVSEPYQNSENFSFRHSDKVDFVKQSTKDFKISANNIVSERKLNQHKKLHETENGSDIIGGNTDHLDNLCEKIVTDDVRETVNDKTEIGLHHNAAENVSDASVSNDFSIEEVSDISQFQENHVYDQEQGRLSSTPEPGVNEKDESLVVVTLSLEEGIISQLEQLFGPIGDNIITGNLEVPINLETARLLHQCVMKGVQDDRQAKYKQLKEDEEFARRLQEEQDLDDSRKHPSSFQRGNTPSGFRIPPVKPLAEIMEEEMTKQTAQEELQKYLEAEGGHTAIATRMKRQKLYESFPKVDKTLLDQIFQANCYNLSETIESIQSSLSYQPVQRVMTGEMEEKYDRQLIESIKQRSVLDTYEDYDDIVDAGFEDYRGEATLHHKLRQECFQKAQEAYRKGLKQVASFYSNQGHSHTQKLKEANMRASEQILEDRRGELETKMTLDLHGLHVDEAIVALDRILPVKEKEKYKSHLKIITGRGRHSHHGVPRLRPAVLAYLQKNQYNFTELHPGAFRVTLKNR